MATKSSNSIFLITVVAVLALAFGVYLQSTSDNSASSEAIPDGSALGLEKLILLPKTKPLRDVDFVDHRAQNFGPQQLEGYWTLMFFGFTHCPDICPTTMQTLAQVKKQLEADSAWGNYRVIMVSVDPQRDTAQKLASYVPFFDADFVGLTGDVAITEKFARQLGILFIARDARENGSYDVDHSAAIVVLNPAGEMAGVIPAPHQRDEIAGDLLKLADYYQADHAAPVNEEKASETEVVESAKDTAVATSATASTSVTSLEFSEQWIRPAPPGVSAMAGYLTITNTGTEDVRLTEASAPGFDEVMIHSTVEQDGMVGMQHMSELLIAAGKSVELRPLATHLMLIDPDQDLKSGTQVNITLGSADGTEFELVLPVRPDPRESE